MAERKPLVLVEGRICQMPDGDVLFLPGGLAGRHWVEEVPQGEVDGANVTFTIEGTPAEDGMFIVLVRRLERPIAWTDDDPSTREFHFLDVADAPRHENDEFKVRYET